jgi:hypothetical protein
MNHAAWKRDLDATLVKMAEITSQDFWSAVGGPVGAVYGAPESTGIWAGLGSLAGIIGARALAGRLLKARAARAMVGKKLTPQLLERVSKPSLLMLPAMAAGSVLGSRLGTSYGQRRLEQQAAEAYGAPPGY